MMILFSASLSSLIPDSYGGITILFWSSLTNTFNNNFLTNFVSEWLPIENLRQSLAVGDWKTCVCCRIQLYIAFLTFFFFNDLAYLVYWAATYCLILLVCALVLYHLTYRRQFSFWYTKLQKIDRVIFLH